MQVKEQIFSQIKVYSDQIIYWDVQLKKNLYKPGEYEQTKKNIKKNNDLIDVLLDKYNAQKNLCSCP